MSRRTCFQHRSPLALAAMLLLLASPGLAEPDTPVPTTRARQSPVFTAYFENDSITGTDQHYTNGLKFSWLSADLRDWGQTGWRQAVLDHLPFVNRADGQKNIGFAFGQNIYTPRNIEIAVPDPTDRPYAGWSYFEFAFVSKTVDLADTLSFQIGIVGPHSFAEDSQRLVHEWINSARPLGWDYQLRDELGINVVYERRWRLYGRSLGQTLGVDLVPHAGVSLGNVQTYANGGGTLRLGLNLPTDFGVQLARPGSVGGAPADDADPRVAANRDFSLFVFAAADGRAVARDLFLDGNTFRDSRSVDKEHFVADLSVGAGLIAGPWQLTFTQVRRTREFKTQPESFNDFASITLSRAF